MDINYFFCQCCLHLSVSSFVNHELIENYLYTYMWQTSMGSHGIIRLINLTCVCVCMRMCVCVSSQSKLAIISPYGNYIIKTSLS